MRTLSTLRSNTTYARLSVILLVVCVLAVYGCSKQPTDAGITTDTVMDQTAAFVGLSDVDQETIEGTMQMSPDKINVRNVGTSESIQALVSVVIPAGYVLTDYDFTLSFNGEDVTTAYDVYYCPIDNNMKISFSRSEILASPVTLKYVNTVAVAAVNGYFRVEDENGGYDTSLSTVDDFEIFDPAHANKTDVSARTVSEQ